MKYLTNGLKSLSLSPTWSILKNELFSDLNVSKRDNHPKWNTVCFYYIWNNIKNQKRGQYEKEFSKLDITNMVCKYFKSQLDTGGKLFSIREIKEQSPCWTIN